MYECEIVCDSVSNDGARLTTMKVTYPRFIHCEMMTHRVFSRNAGSSRAIPVMKMLNQIREDPVFPAVWGSNQAGMQAGPELDEQQREEAGKQWASAFKTMYVTALKMNDMGVHKQIVNRLLEPFSWITVIISSTQWSNFFAQRCHPDAQPEMQKIAHMMRATYFYSKPTLLADHEWHLPLFLSSDEPLIDKLVEGMRSSGQDVTNERKQSLKCEISAARCARVSYLTHDGRRDLDEDLRLFDRLVSSGHWSPLEHVATPSQISTGNFVGWMQLRKLFPDECR